MAMQRNNAARVIYLAQRKVGGGEADGAGATAQIEATPRDATRLPAIDTAHADSEFHLISYLDQARPVAVASVLAIVSLLVLLLQVRLAELLPPSYRNQTIALAGLLSLATLVMLVWRVRTFELRRRARELELKVEARTRELSNRTDELLAAVREKAQLIAQLRQSSEAFERQAREDALTGLANRRQFDATAADWFASCRRAGRPISAALIDLDHFKDVNDRHSHATGDAVLRRLGELIQEHCSELAISARYGGEEFALLFPNCGVEAAAEFCERLREAFARCEFAEIDQALRVTLSAGVADDPSAESHERLLAAADAALYRAKRAGRNRVNR